MLKPDDNDTMCRKDKLFFMIFIYLHLKITKHYFKVSSFYFHFYRQPQRTSPWRSCRRWAWYRPLTSHRLGPSRWWRYEWSSRRWRNPWVVSLILLHSRHRREIVWNKRNFVKEKFLDSKFDWLKKTFTREKLHEQSLRRWRNLWIVSLISCY